MHPAIPTHIEDDATPRDDSPRTVARELQRLIDDGARLRPAGDARDDPMRLLRSGYAPRHAIELFGYRFYLTAVRQNPLLRFMVAYVVAPAPKRGPRKGKPQIHPRIFYKDVSLVWRCASHIVHNRDELWIGKGDIRVEPGDDHDLIHTVESTTDLPLELQHGIETVMRRTRRIQHDEKVLTEVLRNAPPHRLQPYRDFTAPRRRAEGNPKNLINRGRPVARFRRKHDPTSLVFTPGFEPDFARRGLISHTQSYSTSYGGEIQRFRVLSKNRRIQYLFLASPTHAWIIPPQALTTELSTYGVRTIHVEVDDLLCVPAFEYHFLEYSDDPESLHTQIPPGFAGAACPQDPDRADASAWLEQLPVIREFRRKLL
ncbi:MAG: hypothetical protein PVI30_18110 [Myxococcales bacterium]